MGPSTSLSELFDIDPEQLTDAQKDAIIAALRDSRKIWNKEQNESPSRTGRRSGRMPKPGRVLTLDDLGDITID